MTTMCSPAVTVAQSLHPDLARCLRALFVHARTLHGGNFHRWVVQQRLQPLVYGVDGAVDEFFSAAFIDESRQVYFQVIGQSHRFLAEAERIKAVLRANGISALAWRGAVYGQDLYGDSGLRCCSDLDILVAPAQQRSALRALTVEGYRLRGGSLPAWFLARHHLHWPMVSPDGVVPIDVHWAVDHPYAIGPRVGTDVFLDRTNDAAQILLAVLHVEKEARLRTCASEEEVRDRVLRIGPVLPWLDLALMVAAALRNGREEELDRLVAMHGATALMARARGVLSRWFDVAGGGPLVFERTSRPGKVAGHRWSIRLAERLGCRADVLMDWVDYIREPVSRCERMTRCVKILRLAGDTALCGISVGGRRMIKMGRSHQGVRIAR